MRYSEEQRALGREMEVRGNIEVTTRAVVC